MKSLQSTGEDNHANIHRLPSIQPPKDRTNISTKHSFKMVSHLPGPHSNGLAMILDCLSKPG